jgi:hypothetical protein
MLHKYELAKAMGVEPPVYYRGRHVTARVLKSRGYMTFQERNSLNQGRKLDRCFYLAYDY